MPIKIPNNLPARKILEKERVPLISDERAARQDIRPLQILILNLMPDKISTETQLLRVLGATPLQLDVTFMHPASHESKNTPPSHLNDFYVTHDKIKNKYFDALIVTGAPIDHLPFEEVRYWQELTNILDWATTHIYSSFFLCWGGYAALHHYHGMSKRLLGSKSLGVFPHKKMVKNHPLTFGFDDRFGVPVARATEMDREEILAHDKLTVLVESDDSGVCLVEEAGARRLYMFNHLEYESDTIKNEYERDIADGMDVMFPINYFPDDDPTKQPRISWRAHRNLLFGNWINQVYQGTPYDLTTLDK